MRVETYQSTLFISCNDEKAPVSPACFDEVAAFLSNKNEKVSSVLSIIMSADRTVADIVIIQDVDRPYIDPAATVQSLCDIAARHNCAVRGNLYILAESCNLASMEICCVSDGKAIVLDATSGPEKAISRKRKIIALRSELEYSKKAKPEEKNKNCTAEGVEGMQVLHVKVDAKEVVHSIDPRIDEAKKEIIYYAEHDPYACSKFENQEDCDLWDFFMRENAELELQSIDHAKKYAFDKYPAISERHVHYAPPGEVTIPEYYINMSEWTFSLIPRNK